MGQENIKIAMKQFEDAIGEYATAEQQMPYGTGKGFDIAELVKFDIEARIAKGRAQYGERLTSHNGRDALMDAYQESLDLALYLRQAIAERDSK